MKGCVRFLYLFGWVFTIIFVTVVQAHASQLSMDDHSQWLSNLNSNATSTFEDKPPVQFTQPQSTLMKRDREVFMLMGHLIVNGQIWLIHPAVILLGAQLRLVAIFASLSMSADELSEDNYNAISLYANKPMPEEDKVAIKTQGLVEVDRLLTKKFRVEAAKLVSEQVINMAGVREASHVTVKEGVIELGSGKTVNKVKHKAKHQNIKLVLERTSMPEALSAMLLENNQSIDGGILMASALKGSAFDPSNQFRLTQMLVVHSPLIFGGLWVQAVNINSALYQPLFLYGAVKTDLISTFLANHIPTLEMEFTPEVQIWAERLKVRCELVRVNDIGLDL